LIDNDELGGTTISVHGVRNDGCHDGADESKPDHHDDLATGFLLGLCPFFKVLQLAMRFLGRGEGG
jgi:hypothetical protein